MIRTCISLKVLNRFSLSSVGRTSIASLHTPVMCCDDHTTSPVNNIMPVSAIYSNSVPYVCNGHTYTIPKDYQLRVIQHNRDIPQEHKSTVIGDFLRVYRGEPITKEYKKGEFLAVSCMDLRLKLASVNDLKHFLIRVAGANASKNTSSISIPISKGIRNVFILPHTNCKMSYPKEDEFIQDMRE